MPSLVVAVEKPVAQSLAPFSTLCLSFTHALRSKYWMCCIIVCAHINFRWRMGPGLYSTYTNSVEFEALYDTEGYFSVSR